MKYSLDDLLQMNVSWQKTDFLFFWGHANRTEKLAKSCLSQWYPASFIVDGAYYNCAEQYMMAEKARLFGDEDVRSQILSEYHPMAIKKLGRKVRNYDDAVWKARRFDVVVEGNMAKFSQNSKLGDFLLETGEKILVEASPNDDVWGIGLDENSAEACCPRKWKGTNLLGFALMEVRDRLRSDEIQSNQPLNS